MNKGINNKEIANDDQCNSTFYTFRWMFLDSPQSASLLHADEKQQGCRMLFNLSSGISVEIRVKINMTVQMAI
jgi:hypothetical protein